MNASKERLPDRQALLRICGRSGRINVCTRHLNALDGPAHDIVVASPRTAAKAARDAAWELRRKEWEEEERKKKQRAKVLAAARSLQASAARLAEQRRAVLRQVSEYMELVRTSQKMLGEEFVPPPPPALIGVALLPEGYRMNPERLESDRMLDYYYIFRSAHSLRAFLGACKIDLGRLHMDPSVAGCLVLARLRRAMPYKELGHLFNVSEKQAKRGIKKALPFMAAFAAPKLCPRDQLQLFIPPGHAQLLPKAVLVVDGTYIYTSAPQAGGSQRVNFVAHKNRHAQKILVFCYPNGQPAYVSGPHAGDSDEVITLLVLNTQEVVRAFFRVGDQLIGDRGFQDIGFKENVRKALGFLIDVLHPAAKTDGQALVEDASLSRIISSVRACVEQFNARLKKAHLLKGIYPLSELSMLGDYVQLMSGLVTLVYEPLYGQEELSVPVESFNDSANSLPGPVATEPTPARKLADTVVLRDILRDGAAQQELWDASEPYFPYRAKGQHIEAALVRLAPTKANVPVARLHSDPADSPAAAPPAARPASSSACSSAPSSSAACSSDAGSSDGPGEDECGYYTDDELAALDQGDDDLSGDECFDPDGMDDVDDLPYPDAAASLDDGIDTCNTVASNDEDFASMSVEQLTTLTERSLLELNVSQLKDLCKQHGLTLKGNKADLVHKLQHPDNPLYQTKQKRKASGGLLHRGVYPCRQLLLWIALVRVENGTQLTSSVASDCFPGMSEMQVRCLMNSVGGRLSVNPRRNACVERAKRVLLRGDNVHLLSPLQYWLHPEGDLGLVYGRVQASMQGVDYKVFLLFQWKASVRRRPSTSPRRVSCNLVRWYCECHYGFTLHCGHKAVVLLCIGVLQRLFNIPRYRLDGQFATLKSSRMVRHLQRGRVVKDYLTEDD